MYNFTWFIKLMVSAGICGVCAGMPGCVRVCGTHARLVCGCAHMCMGVPRYTWICAWLCVGVLRSSSGEYSPSISGLWYICYTTFLFSNQIHFNVNYDDIRACVCRLFDLKIIIFSCLFVTQINWNFYILTFQIAFTFY